MRKEAAQSNKQHKALKNCCEEQTGVSQVAPRLSAREMLACSAHCDGAQHQPAHTHIRTEEEQMSTKWSKGRERREQDKIERSRETRAGFFFFLSFFFFINKLTVRFLGIGR